ncbi:indole-3-glycerol phosphate synthase TrpC [Paenibacillus sp. y28]|uniref:indole-3-glycerol phosphate synthase TrpC n=1 Tax=Paenibacillus sp. y28 TaxID=3129110 RepID=UPI00301848FB
MYLDRIVATKRSEVDHLKLTTPLGALEKQIASMPACLGFEASLKQDGRKRQIGLIAEVKKASPSKGLIRPDFHPVELAKAYASAGTDCISVLTDEQYFQGKNEYLSAIREAVRVPLLRKDFTIDVHQIYEARTLGADAILLIAAILTTDELRLFHQEAKAIGLDVLVEVHDEAELDRVLELDATLIGINNRNLQTFVTDIQTTEKLIGRIPGNRGITAISESGVSTPEDVAYLQSVGSDGILVGESLMRKDDVGAAVVDLLGPVPTGV